MKTERYLDENGDVVFTERFLIKLGSCCGNGCRHCPYTPRHQSGNTALKKLFSGGRKPVPSLPRRRRD